MIIASVAICIITVICIGLYAVANYFFKQSFERPPKKSEIIDASLVRMRRKGQGDYADKIEEGMKYFASLPCTDEYIESYDGLRLHAKYYKNGDSHRTVVMLHGFRSVGEFDFSCAFEMDVTFGCNILLIDQRAHGESEGDYICFGTKERYDARDWCGFLAERDPECEIVLSGISMGATTALLAAGMDDLPKNVIGVTADCGYVSPHEEFVHVMKTALKLPRFPLLLIADMICRHRAGFGFKDVSTLDAVKNIKIPVLFMHGEGDDFVPYVNTVRNFEACASERKRLISVDSSDHGMSFLADEARCRREIKEFFDNL